MISVSQCVFHNTSKTAKSFKLKKFREASPQNEDSFGQKTLDPANVYHKILKKNTDNRAMQFIHHFPFVVGVEFLVTGGKKNRVRG